MSITFNELLHGNLISDVPIVHQHNLEELLVRINKVRDAWNRPMIVTSGYRTLAEHQDIYNRQWIKAGRPEPKPKVPMQSAHLSGCAVDIADADGSLQTWLRTTDEGKKVLEDAELFCEDGTVGWTHFQSIMPKSCHRWFLS